MNCLDGVVERDARPPMLVKEVREVREVKARCFVACANKRTIGFNSSNFFNFSIFSKFF